MYFIIGLLLFLCIFFFISGYIHNDDYQKLIAWIMLIACIGVGIVIFLAFKAQ